LKFWFGSGVKLNVVRRAGGARHRRVRAFAALDQPVEQAAVVGRDVLHVGHVLVAALDLEAAHAGVDQRREVLALVVVPHRQHVLLVRDDPALAVLDLVGQAAGLRAVAAVGAAPGVRMADEALAAVGHARRAVDEELERAALGVEPGMDGLDLRQREFARQHDLREARVLQESGLLQRADVGLGAGVQLDRRQVDLQQAHVLHDQHVGAGVVHVPGHAPRGLEFVIAQDGVERDEDARAEAVRMAAQPLDVPDAVAGRCPRAEARPADVDGVGAMVDGLDADLGIARGCQEFELMV
jgi:hypothetical protein